MSTPLQKELAAKMIIAAIEHGKIDLMRDGTNGGKRHATLEEAAEDMGKAYVKLLSKMAGRE